MQPHYQTEGSSGADLRANVVGEVVLRQGERAVIPTGLWLELPEEVEAQIRPRSGLAARHGITVLNSPGTVDSDYRGEVKVVLINLGEHERTVRRGDRIAQIVLAPVFRASFEVADGTSATERGSGGFGSTGI